MNMKGIKMAKSKYVVVRSFKYNGVVLEPGDPWTPDGGFYDSKIMSNWRLVKPVDAPEEVADEQEAKKARSKAQNKRKVNKAGKLKAKPKKKQKPKPKAKAKVKAKKKV